MNEDKNRRLAEWYGTGESQNPVGQNREPDGTASFSSQIPPRRPSGSSPTWREPYWSENCEPHEPDSKRRHTGARIAGVCLLLVLVIAATALLFSGDSIGFVKPPASTDAPENYEDYRDYFAHYYDSAASQSAETTLPRAQTGTGVTLETTPRPEDGELDLSGVYDRCANSVVAITSYAGDGVYMWGSGIIMTSDGYILTNAHVLEGAAESTVTLWDDREYSASLVGSDSASDIAVIKINAVGLTPAEFCADTVRVGEAVAAIGNPLGPELRGTMTNGIISALSRDISYTNHPMTLIQTNVAINEGNSGGPLLNMYGQVVGMTSMKLVSAYTSSSIDGIGFAIPVDTIKQIADTLIENGRVVGRPALGITVGTMPGNVAKYYEIPDALFVSAVAPGSDAAAKGVQVGDIIVSADGEHMSETGDLSAVVDAKEVGQTVSLEIYRPEGTVYINVELMETADLY